MSAYLKKHWPALSRKLKEAELSAMEKAERQLLHLTQHADFKEFYEASQRLRLQALEVRDAISAFECGIHERMGAARSELEASFAVTLNDIDRREAALQEHLDLVVATLRDAGRLAVADLVLRKVHKPQEGV